MLCSHWVQHVQCIFGFGYIHSSPWSVYKLWLFSISSEKPKWRVLDYTQNQYSLVLSLIRITGLRKVGIVNFLLCMEWSQVLEWKQCKYFNTWHIWKTYPWLLLPEYCFCWWATTINESLNWNQFAGTKLTWKKNN